MIDWNDNVKKYNLLGLWHATNYLKHIRTVKDPTELAHDVVQEAWITLWKKDRFTKGLFVAVVMGLASNAARDSRPIEISYQRMNGSRRSRITNSFPVQIFGTYLHEVTMDEAIKAPSCGDE